jgi:hypothetical protein
VSRALWFEMVVKGRGEAHGFCFHRRSRYSARMLRESVSTASGCLVTFVHIAELVL